MMDNLQRFLAVVRFEEPDYVPIFGFPGAPGMSWGAMKKTQQHLLDTGMPAEAGGCYNWGYAPGEAEKWFAYWGTTGPVSPDFALGQGAPGIKSTRRVEGEFEIIEDECGAVTRQVLENNITYSMPEFVRYGVRDRASWEFWRDRMTPRSSLTQAEIAQRCRAYEGRTRPLCVGAGSTYGFIRSLFGPEGASYVFYDDPQLVHDMMAWQLDMTRTYIFPLIERLRPEIVAIWEDLCYNHGMLISPAQFDEFFGRYYREVCSFARSCQIPLITVDSDGNAMEFTDVAASYGVNSLHPYEVKGGNDLFAIRRKHPRLVLFGWLEKEVVNEGNEGQIETEIRSKVPALLKTGGYFPNGDHGIQPPATFGNLCRFMTILHEVCGNPEGRFPRT